MSVYCTFMQSMHVGQVPESAALVKQILDKTTSAKLQLGKPFPMGDRWTEDISSPILEAFHRTVYDIMDFWGFFFVWIEDFSKTKGCFFF